MIEINSKFEQALEKIRDGKNLFITGKAGTGKSTLLNYFRDMGGNAVVLAPTGVAALNVFGQTIHSFFGFRPDITVEKIIGEPLKHKSIYRAVKTIIIDEASMVRADLLDCIDIFLRKQRANQKAFGGVQMVFIGDLYQLPPVLTWQESKAFHTIYKSPYFFSSNAFGDYDFEIIELDKIYRQNDQQFINLLNNVRINEMTPADFQKLNSRHIPYSQNGNMTITLTTTKSLAETVNNYFMGELPGKESQYQGTLSGNFDKSYMPTAMDLQLKAGAQVMMLNNDPGGRWVNGTIGKLEQVADKFVKILLAGQDDAIRIDPYRWEIFRTFLNEDNKLETSSIGSFSQLPLMPAWAITIHKCVSGETLIPTVNGLLTMNELAGDIEKSGTFKKINLEIIGLNGNKIATQIYKGFNEPSLIIKTRQGYEIEGSYRHPILIYDDTGIPHWKKLPDIRIGDIVAIRSKTMAEGNALPLISILPEKKHHLAQYFDCPVEVVPDFAWLLGLIIGDGSCADKRDGRIEFHNTNQELLSSFSNLSTELLGVKVTIRKSGAYYNNLHTRKYLFNLGLKYSCGPQKITPWIIRQSSLTNQKAYLQGLFDTDGGVSKTCIHFTTTSKQLSQEVQLLLLNFGIISNRCQMKTLGKYNTPYRVSILGRNAVKFANTIGFRHLEKQLKAISQYGSNRTIVPKSNTSFIPNGKEIILELRSYLRKRAKTKAFMPNAPRLVYKLIARIIQGKRCHLSTEHIPYLQAFIPDLKDCGDTGKTLVNLYENGIFFDTVKSITDSQCDMFDLFVPDGHDFVGNGFVNHNSQGKTFDKIIINTGKGAFAHGQIYVALSRCRDLDGIVLRQPIQPSHIHVDQEIKEFMRSKNV